MAMSITLADNADVDPYEGENIDASWADTHRDEVGKQAEAYLCVLVKYDVVTNWASLNAIYKVMFTEYVARSIAITGIAWDMSNFTDRVEAENMININWARLRIIEKLLAKADIQDFQGT